MNHAKTASPQWHQSLLNSLNESENEARANYFQMANIDNLGLPRNRTMVFRGFQEGTLNLLATTDSRCKKFAQIQQNSNAEICWYFDISREQYRINCSVQLITNETNKQYELSATNLTNRNRLWLSLSQAARSQFYWPEPGVRFTAKARPAIEITQSAINNDLPPNNFVVLVFVPNEVEYLNLANSPHSRRISQLSVNATHLIHQWEDTQVTP